MTVTITVRCWDCGTDLRIRLEGTYAAGLCGCCGATIEVDTEQQD